MPLYKRLYSMVVYNFIKVEKIEAGDYGAK
jgi:hypothetical protein